MYGWAIISVAGSQWQHLYLDPTLHRVHGCFVSVPSQLMTVMCFNPLSQTGMVKRLLEQRSLRNMGSAGKEIHNTLLSEILLLNHISAMILWRFLWPAKSAQLLIPLELLALPQFIGTAWGGEETEAQVLFYLDALFRGFQEVPKFKGEKLSNILFL